jgi:hypothetical protein
LPSQINLSPRDAQGSVETSATLPTISCIVLFGSLFKRCSLTRGATLNAPRYRKEQIKVLKKEHYKMSVPNQTSAPDALKGGNNFVDERRGNEHVSQVFPLSGHNGVEAQNDQPASTVQPNLKNGAASRPPESVSGMNAGAGREFTAKRVDQVDVSDFERHMPADKVGDVAKASNRQAAEGQGGPRASMGQFPNGKECR